MDKKKSLTTGEVAKLCDVSIPTIHKWIREERITCFKMPGSGKLRIPRDQVYHFMKSYGFPIEGEHEEKKNKNVLLLFANENYDNKFEESIAKYDDYNCHIVNNVFSAGMYAMSEAPDIIFVDLSVQGIEPQDFCKTLIQSTKNNNVLVIAVSKAFSVSQQNKLKKFGFCDFLELPLKTVTFKKKLDLF